MPTNLEIAFSRSAAPSEELAVLLTGEDGKLADAAATLDPGNVLRQAIRVAGYKGKSMAVLEVIAPAGSPAGRIVIAGVGDPQGMTESFWPRLGGQIFAQIRKASKTTVYLDTPGVEATAAQAADLALGMLLRAYKFDRYKTKKDEADEGPRDGPVKVIIVTRVATAARKAFAASQALGDSVALARDLVNEPANVLGPSEFAGRARQLEHLGVNVQVLNERDVRKLGMGALLGVAQGSSRPPRLVVMQWNGGKARTKPVAFVGKGVVFDTGGNSIKSAGGMEDMKGDMAGAAAVTGVMHALAARKASVNAVGILGLVENMTDGNAQRPGDIVKSMSGQTVEVLNTDAEGRLVLADALWYCQERFRPRFIVDLATLTGAVIVALGQHHAGLFSNDDELAAQLAAAGSATGEKVWRMPLGADYDKMLDSRNADMKNIGGRHAGSITAAQFLQRFVKAGTVWAHLDIAGTALASPANEINQSWASGFGVRLLERLVRDHYEG